MQWRNAEHSPPQVIWVTHRSRWHHEQLPKRCFSSASFNPLSRPRSSDAILDSPCRCSTDLETTETPLVCLFRSYYSAPEQQRSCLSRFRSASPSSPRPGDTCHEVFDMKNSTSSFAHDGWGITSSPNSCTCFGDCAGQDLSHTGYKLCWAPDIYCPPESVSFCPTLNFTLIPFHMRESWQEQDPRQPEGEETRFKGRRFPAEGLSMVHVHTCPFSHILVLPLPSRWGFDTRRPEITQRPKVSGQNKADIPAGGEQFLRSRASSPSRKGRDGTTGLYRTVQSDYSTPFGQPSSSEGRVEPAEPNTTPRLPQEVLCQIPEGRKFLRRRFPKTRQLPLASILRRFEASCLLPHPLPLI